FQRSQFSFIRGRSLPSVPRASRDWQEAVAIAKIVDEELHPSPMGKAMFFHARRVSPRWRLTRVGTLGNHVFYR
ncbi:MAG TPA: cell wall hydrolase, partial [Sphingomicrobium sp.]